VVGVGGIFTGADAYEKIRAGASWVQLYTGFIYRGPGVARSILRELEGLLKRDGYASVTEAIGSSAHR
jgi:dihydroorotate dehydrogenase